MYAEMYSQEKNMIDSEDGLLVREEDVTETVEDTLSNETEVSENITENSESEETIEEVSEGEPEEALTDDQQPEKLDWVKKRLAQKDRQTKRQLREKDAELEELKRQVAAVYNPSTDESQAGKILDPTTGSYVEENSTEGLVIKKLQQIRQAELAQRQYDDRKVQVKSFNDKIQDLKDQYDDYEDVVEQATSHLTPIMVETMIASPGSVEVFYNTWKSNPEKLVEISKLRPVEQMKAMNFLEFQAQNQVKQKLISNAPRPISPVKPSAKTVVDDGSFEAIMRRKRVEQKRMYGDK
jgi:hypothetical protein